MIFSSFVTYHILHAKVCSGRLDVELFFFAIFIETLQIGLEILVVVSESIGGSCCVVVSRGWRCTCNSTHA